MQDTEDIVLITQALRDSAMIDYKKLVALETVQEQRLQDLNQQVQSEIERRASSPSGIDMAVDSAWSSWVRRERASILREIARIRAVRIPAEEGAKMALSKFNAAGEIDGLADQAEKARASKHAGETFAELSILKAISDRQEGDH